MSRNFAFGAPLLALLLFAAEMPLSDERIVPVWKVEGMPAAAALGDQMLVAWNDGRVRNAVFAARFAPDGRRLDAAPIRFIPSRFRILYEQPAATSDGRSFVVAFTERDLDDWDHPHVSMARVAANGEVVDGPGIVAAGQSPIVASDGSTILLACVDDRRPLLMLFSRELKPLATIRPGAGEVMTTAATHSGYIAVMKLGDDAHAIPISADGATQSAIPLGYAHFAAAASNGDRTVVLTSWGPALQTISIGGTMRGPEKIADCGSQAFPISIIASGEGFFATAACNREFQKVTIPPPLPDLRLHTLRIDGDGALLDIKTLHAERYLTAGRIVNAGGELLVPTAYEGNSSPGGIARIAHGSLVQRAQIALGAPPITSTRFLRDGDADIFRWTEIRGLGDAPTLVTRITRDGVDPKFRGVVDDDKKKDARPSDDTRVPDGVARKLRKLVMPFTDGQTQMVVGGGDDGYMVVVNQSPMMAFHVDRRLRHVTPLGEAGRGTAQFVRRRKGYGIVVYERNESEAPFFGASRYFATITK